jgi:hypothetical protein
LSDKTLIDSWVASIGENHPLENAEKVEWSASMEHLFPDFIDKVKENHTVRCQIGVLRLKKTASVGQMELSQPYLNALDQIDQINALLGTP